MCVHEAGAESSPHPPDPLEQAARRMRANVREARAMLSDPSCEAALERIDEVLARAVASGDASCDGAKRSLGAAAESDVKAAEGDPAPRAKESAACTPGAARRLAGRFVTDMRAVLRAAREDAAPAANAECGKRSDAVSAVDAECNKRSRSASVAHAERIQVLEHLAAHEATLIADALARHADRLDSHWA